MPVPVASDVSDDAVLESLNTIMGGAVTAQHSIWHGSVTWPEQAAAAASRLRCRVSLALTQAWKGVAVAMC